MKKINSVGYGHKIIGAAVVFLVLIPAVTWLLSSITKQIAFLLFAKISLALGFAVLLFLLILLKIEFFQDKRIAKYFEANKNIKLRLKNGLCECQTCGNKQVKPEHKNCNVCGATFKNQEGT